MKIIKPMKLGILHKTFTFRFKHHSVISPVVFFRIAPEDKLGINVQELNADAVTTDNLASNVTAIAEKALAAEVLPENIQWPLIQEALGNDILDMVMPKPRSEVLVAGKAFNPDSDTNYFQTALQVGSIQKVLNIYGQREWTRGIFGYSKTDPKPVTSVELSQMNSFGGEGSANNPLGMGLYADKKAQPLLLPAIENPNEPITSIKQKPESAGFGQIPITHSLRAKFNGDYQHKDWLEKHFPAMAPDTNMALFQAARPDQQFENYLQGNEKYLLANLHPEQSLISGQLPDVRPRAFVTRDTPDIDQVNLVEEVSLNLDTVWFFPNQEVGALIYRGQIEVSDPDGLDISNIMLAYENNQDEPRNLDYYQQVLNERLDPETAILVVADESQLSPEKTAQQIQAEEEEIQQEETDQAALMAEQQAQTLEDIKEANGGQLPPGFELPPEPKPTVLVSKAAIKRGDFNIKALMADAQAQKTQAQQKQKELQAEMASQQKQVEGLKAKVDPQQLAALTAKKPLSEQVKSMQSSMQDMADKNKDVDIDTEKLEQIQQLQEQASQYAMTPLSDWPEDALAQEKRLVFVAALEADETLSQRDWSGCDLSNLDLSGKSLSACNLENCNLENTLLQGCDLIKTGFAGAKLIRTDFSNASLQEANFSSAVGFGNIFNQANMEKCLLLKSFLPESQFQHCQLNNINAMDADFTKSRFSGSQMDSASFINCQLSDCDYDQITATMLSFIQCDLTLSRWQHARLVRSAFLECPMPMSNLAEVQFEKVQFSGKTALDGSQLSSSALSQCGLRRISAQHIKASRTLFNQCDLGDSQLQLGHFNHAQFIQAVMSDSDFSGGQFNDASLYTSLLRKTQLSDCELSNCNFLEADAVLSDVQNSNYQDAINIAPLIKRRWQNAQSHAQ